MQPYIEKINYQNAPEGVAIYLVDGQYVRDNISTEFIGGGHDKVYSFVPPGEVWVDSALDPSEVEAIILHELDERDSMGEGLSYEDAHDKATQYESLVRSSSKRIGQLFAPRVDTSPFGGKQKWEMTKKEYLDKFVPGWLSSWKNQTDIEDPKTIDEATQYATRDHKRYVYDALYRGDPVPEDVLKDYPEFLSTEPLKNTQSLSTFSVDDLRRANHVYRGMEQEEFLSTVAAGVGVYSTGKYSLPSEGTCFAIHPGSALGYAAYGRSDPRETGVPVYLVEVVADKNLMFKDVDDYVKARKREDIIPQDHVTRIWEISGKGQELYIKEITSSSKKAYNINKEDLRTLWYEDADGNYLDVDLYDDKGTPNLPPEEAKYQVSRFPNVLRTTYLELTDEGSKEVFSGESSFSDDLVLALVESGDFTLDEAIIFAAEACERCSNSAASAYGLAWGYPEGSEDWEASKTSCDFCRHLAYPMTQSWFDEPPREIDKYDEPLPFAEAKEEDENEAKPKKTKVRKRLLPRKR